MEGSGNFFAEELSKHYSEQGKNLSEQVIQVLNLSQSDLSKEEEETFKGTILPAREHIIQALIARLKRPGVSEDEWREQLLFYSQTIIGQIVAEIFSEPKVKADIPPPDVSQETPNSSKNFRPTELAVVQAIKSKKKYKKSWVIGLLVILGIAVVVGTLFLTVFKSGEVLSHEGLQIKIPEGYEYETGQAYEESCGIKQNWIRLYPSGEEESVFGTIYLEYPCAFSVFFSKKEFESQPYHEDTTIGGQRALLYGGGEDWGVEGKGAFSIYLVESQVWIFGGEKHKEAMLEIAESAEGDYKKYNVPAPLQAGSTYLEGTWRYKDDPDVILRLATSEEQGTMLGAIDGFDCYFWGEANGWVFNNEGSEQAGYDGFNDIDISLVGDGSELLALILITDMNSYQQYNYFGHYEKVSKDPLYGLESNSDSAEYSGQTKETITLSSEFTEDVATGVTTLFMDAIVAKKPEDLPGLSYFGGANEWGQEDYFIELGAKSFSIVDCDKVVSYNDGTPAEFFIVTVEYQDYSNTNHELVIYWIDWDTASRRQIIYRWELDGVTYEPSDILP